MPLVPRQLGIQSLISQALESRISTASEAFFSTTPVVVASTPVQSTTPSVTVSTVIQTIQTTPVAVPTPPVVPTTSAVLSQTPTISVIVFTTTTTASDLTSTTPVVTSSSNVLPSTTPIPSLILTTPTLDTSTIAPTNSRPLSSAAATPSGASSNAGAQAGANNGMSGGIIALIVVGALLIALLAGAFAFRRIQVYRRTKRRENNYGAGAIPDDAPFPFTNVSETDLKGPEPIGRDFRQGSVTSLTEKPLLSVAPAVPYGAPANSNFGQPGFNNQMSGPYPTMAAGAGYGYGQPGRTGSPAPSQAPRMMSQAPPPTAYMRTGSPAVLTQYPKAPTPTPNPQAPTETLAPQFGGKKRVVQTFQPTLPDELDIREGDWVTIVHAYDDGWGMCERSGRRGVVPLECLDLGRSDLRASRRLSSLSAIRQ